MPPVEASSERPPAAPMGPMVGIIIIVALLLAAAVYFAFQQLENQRNIEPPAYIPGDQT